MLRWVGRRLLTTEALSDVTCLTNFAQGKLIGRLSEVSIAQPVDDCLKILGQMLCGGFGKAAVMGSFWQPADQLGSNAAGSDKVDFTAKTSRAPM